MKPEALNKKAIQIINRVRDKLTGECVCVCLLKRNIKSCEIFLPLSGRSAPFQRCWCLNFDSAANWRVSEAIS